MSLLSRFRRRAVDVQKAYAAWAPLYDVGPGNPIQRANDAALQLCVPRAPPRGVALDIACGSGRHQILLHSRGWLRVFGFDLSPEMLGLASGYSGVAVADLRAIPCRPVELVVCSLAIGHLAKLDEVLDPLCEAIRHDGDLVITDLHPQAIRAGMKRTCPGPSGWWELPHTVHDIPTVLAELERRGLTPELVTEPAPEKRLPGEPARANVPVVWAVRAHRRGD